MQAKDQKSSDDDGENPFAETLRVLTIEDLIRIRHRLKKVGRKRMVEILTDEIQEREGIEKERAQVEHAERVQSVKAQKGTH